MPEGVGYKNVQIPSGEVIAFPGDMPDEEINNQIRTFLESQGGAAPEPTRTAGVMRDESGRTLSFPQTEVVRSEHFDPSTPEGKINTTIGALSTVAAAGGPWPFTKSALLGVGGASAGGYAGHTIGQGLEYFGLPAGTSKAAGSIGGLIGGIAAPIGGVGALLKLRAAGGGAGGSIANLAEKLLARGGAGAAGKTAAKAGSKAAGEKLKGSVVRMEPTKTLAEAEARHVSASAAPRAEKAFLDFAKKEGPKFKRGERVWFIRDSSGKPLQTFESGAKADGWLRRKENLGKGYVKDFFQNLWAS